MTIIEYTINTRNKCYGCKWLKLNEDDMWQGHCECPHNKIKNRDRYVTDKKCTWKNADKA
jgi:hypothetical protein